jgi:ribosomal protein S2
VVSRHPKFFELSKSFLSLRDLKYLPAFLFLFDPNISESALFEGYVLGIPTSAIANSDCLFFESINYPVLGNTECYESLYLYMHILRDAIRLGRFKERFNVIRLKSKLKTKLNKKKRKKNIKFVC